MKKYFNAFNLNSIEVRSCLSHWMAIQSVYYQHFFSWFEWFILKKESVILIENASNIQWEILKSVTYYAIKLKKCYKEAFYIILKPLKRSVKTI